MRIVILAGTSSSSVFGGNTGGETPDYLYGEEGRALVGDADVVVAVWSASGEPVVVRAPEGVTVEALSARTRQTEYGGRGTGGPKWETTVALHSSITPDEYITKHIIREEPT